MGDPALQLLLDGDRLSDVLRREVRVTRVRPKPGVSHTAALLDEAGALVGWAQILIGAARVKGVKARDRADRLGIGHLLATVPLPQWDAELLSGPVATDPRLAKPLTRARVVEEPALRPPVPDASLLRYNPLRRVVRRVGDQVVRVTARPHAERLTALALALRSSGVPVVAPVPAARAVADVGDRVTCWPWVEGHDLAGHRTPDSLRAAGRILAHLHTVLDDPGVDLPALPVRTWDSVREGAARAVAQLEQVAPELAGDARAALDGLPSQVPSSRPVLLHGDLSLDQFLLDQRPGVPGDGSVWLTDLERAGVGPRELDLASLRAAEIVEDVARPDGRHGADLGELLQAYDTGSVLAAWEAAALLCRVGEPWRSQGAGWQEGTREIGRRARELSARAGSRGFPVRGRAVRIPARVPDGVGGHVTVGRAWPGSGGAVALEGCDEGGRLRAGSIDPDGRVDLLPAGVDPRLPALRRSLNGAEVVVHRAGRRAVLRTDRGYVKVVRPGKAAAVATAADEGGALIRAAGLRTPAVLDVDDDTVRFEVASGRPVGQLSGDDDEWSRLWACWVAGWTRLQRQSSGTRDLVPRHTPSSEATVVRRWAERAGGQLTGTPWPRRMSAAASEVEQDGEQRLVVAHRDLHDGQLVWDGHAVSVLDLDTVALAEPALDLANLEVHAWLRQAQGCWSEWAVRVVEEAVAHVAVANEVNPGRMAVARRATLARLVAVYAFRPPWRETVLDWAERRWASI